MKSDAIKSIAIFMSHPIQYQVPLLTKIAKNPNYKMHTYFFWDFGVKATYDSEFKTQIKWDIPILEGYEHTFLKNYSWKPSYSFLGMINPGVIGKVFAKKHDAVLIYGWQIFSNWLVIFSAILSNTPIFLQAESPLNQESTKSGVKQWVKQILLKALFRQISGFFYIGEQNKRFFKSYNVPDEKLFFSPYAVNNERYFKEHAIRADEKMALRRKYGIPENTIVFLFVGKFIEKKRPRQLLQAFEHLNEPNAALVLVGDGEIKAEMIKYVEDKKIAHVIFAGFKNQLELPDFYLLADAFVLPSGVGETWGLVVNEAMCFGLPVIISDMVGCGSDLVFEGENGFKFPVDDVSALTESLRKILINSSRLKLMGAKSQSIVSQYSHEKDVEAIGRALEVYG